MNNMDQITPGAYVIRNKSSPVLHIQDPNVKATLSALTLFGQDENQYRNQQIWWVEPLPSLNPGDDDSGGMMYSITNPASGWSLDLNPGAAADGTKTVTQGQRITVRKEHGAPWQRWKIVRIKDREDGVYYKIISDHNDGAVTAYVFLFSYVATRDFSPGDDRQCWEFIIPMAASPPGWFQIRSASTGDILSHPYLSSPPVLMPSPATPKPSQYRETWGAQWTLIHTQNFAPGFPGIIGANTWCIMNRLTRTLLGNVRYKSKGEEKLGVAAWEFNTGDVLGHTWKLELDSAYNWKIINYKTLFLLEQTNIPLGEGKEVICRDRTLKRGEKNKTWVLTSPVVEENPPEYSPSTT